jgi:hypothetical protein
MAKFKQEQIIPGVTKSRSNAVKVYCSEAIAAGDIISVVGVQDDFLSVAKADANGAVTLNGSLLFVADFAAASGEYLPLALPWKLVTSSGLDTSASSIGQPVYLSDTAGGLSLTAGTVGLKIGTVMTVATSGTVLLAPQGMATTGGGVFVSAEQTADGSAQSIAHGLGYVPSRVLAAFSEFGASEACDIALGTHTVTSVVLTVTSGRKYFVIAM